MKALDDTGDDIGNESAANAQILQPVIFASIARRNRWYGVALAAAAVLQVSIAGAAENGCASMSRPQPSSADTPNAADQERLRDCNSESLYYGLGVPANAKDARLCAFIEMEHGVEALPLQGSGILMMIYANGAAVKRNPALAKRYACSLGWDSGELDSLLRRIEAVAKSGASLDACDVVPAGTSLDVCAIHTEAVRLARIDDEVKQTVAHWSVSRRDAYAQLQKAATAYESARSTTESTPRDSQSLQLSRQCDFRREFAALLKAIDSPFEPPSDLKQRDVELNATYGALVHWLSALQTENPGALGLLTTASLRDAERIWLRYVDAWEDFRLRAALPVSAAALRKRLTVDRTEALRRLLTQLQDAG